MVTKEERIRDKKNAGRVEADTGRIKDELIDAKMEYMLALQQEEYAEGEYIDIAIKATNAAKDRVDNVVKKARLMGHRINITL